jgi:hypothetical protein
MSDLGRIIAEQVRAALVDAGRQQRTSVAAAANVNGEAHTVSAYSDQDVTIVQRDGETHVIRHDGEATSEPPEGQEGAATTD